MLAGKRKPDTYLYIPADAETEDLPADLLSLLGELREVITLDITPERQLARCTGAEVLEGLANAGYYLQMPPGSARVMMTTTSYLFALSFIGWPPAWLPTALRDGFSSSIANVVWCDHGSRCWSVARPLLCGRRR